MGAFFNLQEFLQSNNLQWTTKELLSTGNDLYPDRVFGPGDAWQHAEMVKLLKSDDELSSKVVAWPSAIYHLLSHGEPKPSQLTRVGGVPLPIDIANWPRDANGTLLPFIGQVDLRVLTIIGEAAPSVDLVQIFGDTSDSALLWKTASERVYHLERDLSTAEGISAPDLFKLPSFVGTPYVATEPKFLESVKFPLSIKDGYGRDYILWSQVQWPPFALRIGSLDADDSAVDIAPGEQIVASIPSIVPSERPYPFLNIPGPLDEDMRSKYTVDIGGALDMDHWSVVHVALSPESQSGVRLLLE